MIFSTLDSTLIDSLRFTTLLLSKAQPEVVFEVAAQHELQPYSYQVLKKIILLLKESHSASGRFRTTVPQLSECTGSGKTVFV